MTDGKNFFDQLINSELKTYEIIRKNATGKGYDYTTGCLLDYSHFKINYKVVAMDLSKQQVLLQILVQFNKLILSKFRQSWKYDNVLYHWRSKRNYSIKWKEGNFIKCNFIK